MAWHSRARRAAWRNQGLGMFMSTPASQPPHPCAAVWGNPAHRSAAEMAATRLPEVDAVVIGMGLVGTLLSRALTQAGLKVVGLERGEPRLTVPDFQGPQMHDELRY